MATSGELLTPHINVNECLKPEILTWRTRPSTGMPRSARAFNNVACLRPSTLRKSWKA